MPLILLLLAIPTAEIFIFIEVGGIIGTWPTIGIIFATAVIGGMILRWQGLQTIARARQQLAANRIPVAEMAEGAMLAFAAILLLTPGFMTDSIGVLLLFPVLRRRMIRALIARFAGGARGRADFSGPRGRPQPHGDGPVIDGEYTRLDDDETPPPPRGNLRGR